MTNSLKIQANELTFGVEIETTVPSSFSVGGYRNGADRSSVLPAFNNSSWNTTSDSSIRTGGYNRRGCEFVSPILKGTEGLQNLMDLVRVAKTREGEQIQLEDGRSFNGVGAKVNSSCGIHVHVGWDTSDRRFDVKALQRLIHLVAGFENGVFAATGTKGRENGGWCSKTKTCNGMKDLSQRLSRARAGSTDFHRFSSPGRYFGLNLSNLLNGRRNTVEFRFFSSSLNPAKIAGFVQIALGLVQTAISMPRCAHWDASPASARFGAERGQGYRELNRLFTRLKWINRKPGSWGITGMLGNHRERNGSIPSLRESISVLRRMATKYDNEI